MCDFQFGQNKTWMRLQTKQMRSLTNSLDMVKTTVEARLMTNENGAAARKKQHRTNYNNNNIRRIHETNMNLWNILCTKCCSHSNVRDLQAETRSECNGLFRPILRYRGAPIHTFGFQPNHISIGSLYTSFLCFISFCDSFNDSSCRPKFKTFEL